MLDNLTGGVLWAALSAQKRDPKDYWARASFAELCVLLNPKATVQREYRSTVAAAQRDRFALESTRETLTLLRDLQFRPDETAAALEVLDREIARLAAPFVPRQVLLFSGHMVDAPDRKQPRFPAAKLPQATAGPAAGAGRAGRRRRRPAADPGRGRRRPALRRGLPRARRARAAAAAAGRAGVHRTLGAAFGRRRGLAPALLRAARPSCRTRRA